MKKMKCTLPVLFLILLGQTTAVFLSSKARIILQQECEREDALLEEELGAIELDFEIKTTFLPSRAKRILEQERAAEHQLLENELAALEVEVGKSTVAEKPAFLPTRARFIFEHERAHEQKLLEEELASLEAAKPPFVPSRAKAIFKQEHALVQKLLEDELAALEGTKPMVTKPTFMPLRAKQILEQERAHERAMLEKELDATDAGLRNIDAHPGRDAPEHHVWVRNCMYILILGSVASILGYLVLSVPMLSAVSVKDKSFEVMMLNEPSSFTSPTNKQRLSPTNRRRFSCRSAT